MNMKINVYETAPGKKYIATAVSEGLPDIEISVEKDLVNVRTLVARCGGTVIFWRHCDSTPLMWFIEQAFETLIRSLKKRCDDVERATD
jgi:hypothetical protein